MSPLPALLGFCLALALLPASAHECMHDALMQRLRPAADLRPATQVPYTTTADVTAAGGGRRLQAAFNQIRITTDKTRIQVPNDM